MKYIRNVIIGTGTLIVGVSLFASSQTRPLDIYPPPDIPGVVNQNITQATIAQTLCNPSWSTKSIRPSTTYTDKLKVAYMAKYKLPGVKSDYELDHLISLVLGGNPTDLKNLWLEPYNASLPDGGAKNKDIVENRLHKELCNGTITLAEAQSIISKDWYSYYKKQSPTFGSLDNSSDEDDE